MQRAADYRTPLENEEDRDGHWDGRDGWLHEGQALMSSQAPSSSIAIRDAIATERQRLNEWKASAEAHYDREVGRLDRALKALGISAPRSPSKVRSAPGTGRRPKRGRRRMSTTPTAALERREGVFRFALEQDHPVAAGEVRQALNLSDHAAKGALRRLVDEGRLIRVGTGAASRYKPMSKAPGSRAPAPARLKQGTAQGLVLTTIEDRGFASLEELRQATRLSEPEVEAICGGLIREGEIEMERRNGRPVYIRKGGA